MFPDPQLPDSPATEDLEIIAGIIRLLRRGQHRTATAVMNAIQQMHPSEPSEKLRRCAVAAAEALESPRDLSIDDLNAYDASQSTK